MFSGAHGDFVVKTRPNGGCSLNVCVFVLMVKVNIGGTDVVAHLNVERKDCGCCFGEYGIVTQMAY